jgi:hypothetical protein
LEIHHQEADEVGGNQRGGAGEERLGKGWDVLGDRGGWANGFEEVQLQILLYGQKADIISSQSSEAVKCKKLPRQLSWLSLH